MKHKNESRKELEAGDISVVASGEENTRRESAVDETEERNALFGPEKDEDIDLEAEPPLRRPIPSDRPLDITPRTITSDGLSLGMVDQSDEATLAEYERAAREDRRQRRSA